MIGDEGDWAGDAVADLYRPLLTAENGGRAAASSCAPTSRAPRWSSSPPTRSSRRRSRFINEIANVCEETGADVIEVARGMGLDDRIGPKFLQAGHRLRRQLLPQGRLRAQAARRQQRLPLPAAERGHRGQRAAEAARHRQAPEAPRHARRQADRAARPGVQAEHRRHARGHARSCSPRGCRPTGAEVVAYDPIAEEEARHAHARRRARRRRRWRPSTAPTPSCS